jgi:hypothetical protein
MNSLLTPQVLIPLFVSILSISFAIYQYFDKRKIERKNATLELASNELLLKEKQYNLKADLIVFYVDTSLASIFSYEGVMNRIQQHPVDKQEFDRSLALWAKELSNSLPFKCSVFIVKNHKYEELRDYCVNPDDADPNEHALMAMLLRNEGKFPASKVWLAFHKFDVDGSVVGELTKEQAALNIDVIQPGEAALVFISHKNNAAGKKFGIELEPDHQLHYYDNLLQKEVEMEVRIPYATPRLVDKGLLLRG